MRARHRHLNPRFAGASFVLDARRIDAANNAQISQWDDISGNANNVTQATTSKQPTFKTGQQGGQPIVAFAGAGGMVASSGLGGSTSAISIVVTLKSFQHNGTAGGGATLSQGGASAFTNDMLLARTSSKHFSQFNNGTDGSCEVNDPGSGAQIQAHLFDGSQTGNANRSKYFFNGVEQTLTYTATVPASINPSGAYHVGQYSTVPNDNSWYLLGDMCSLSLIKAAISGGLRKKLQHASAYSFKIACS